MAWLHPTVEHLRLVLAEDEIDKLENSSTVLSARVQDTLDSVVDTFRSAFRAKGYNIDIREHYIDDGYLIPCLNLARYQIWSTFPDAENYALTEPRKELYSDAKELLKDPYIGVSKPDYSDDPELSSMNQATYDSAISMPWMKFPAEPFDTGFWQVYPYYRWNGKS